MSWNLQFPDTPWTIRKMVTFLDPGIHETKQEEFDVDIKDTVVVDKRHQKIGIILCG